MSKSVAPETAEITQSQNPPATTHTKRKSKRHSGARYQKWETLGRYLPKCNFCKYIQIFCRCLHPPWFPKEWHTPFSVSCTIWALILIPGQAHGSSGVRCLAAVKPLWCHLHKVTVKVLGEKKSLEQAPRLAQAPTIGTVFEQESAKKNTQLGGSLSRSPFLLPC